MQQENKNNGKPLILPELSGYWDDRMAEAHKQIASMPLSKLRSLMPPLSWSDGPSPTGYVDLSPGEKHDPSDVIAVFLPFADSWDDSAAIRLLLLQRSLPEPRRMVIFPNNTTTDLNMYSLTPEERALVATGDFTPILERHFRILDSLGVKKLQIIGYSQGAAVGAAAIRYAAEGRKYKLGPSALIEPPNAIVRTRQQLRRDFLGAAQFAKVVNDSAVQAFSEVRHTLGGLDNIRLLLMFAQLGRSAALPDNRALTGGFGRGTFVRDLSTALSLDDGLKVFLGGGTFSRILPPEALHKLDELAKQYPKRATCLHLYGYGHELAENIVTYALLFRAGLYPQE